jgi:hypothetical protein
MVKDVGPRKFQLTRSAVFYFYEIEGIPTNETDSEDSTYAIP